MAVKVMMCGATAGRLTHGPQCLMNHVCILNCAVKEACVLNTWHGKLSLYHGTGYVPNGLFN